MSTVDVLDALLPQLSGFRITEVTCTGSTVRIHAEVTGGHARCPACQQPSRRVHSWYERRLLDTAIASRETLLSLRVRRFVCGTLTCGRKIFAEQLTGLTSRYARRTTMATAVLQRVGLALGGRAGARLAAAICLAVGRTSLLRLVRALPETPVGPLTALGVDDFAYRRGHTYGTVLVDMATHQVVDVLDDRSAESLAGWLQQQPGIRVICRDRASCYAEGANRGAPQARQVADRWHLLQNLSEAVRDAIAGQRRALQSASHQQAQPPMLRPAGAPVLPQPPEAQGRLAQRTHNRHADIHTLHNQGLGITAIAQQLGLDRKTVRRFAAVSDPEALIGPCGGRRASVLDAYAAHLHRRCTEGVISTDALLAEIRTQGYRGSHRTLRRYLATIRPQPHTVPTPAPVPSSRDITGWIMRPEAKVTADDRAELDRLCGLCPTLATIRELAQGFTRLVRTRGGEHLAAWVQQAEQSAIPEIRSFAAGLRRDWDAVVAGLTTTWSSGAVEGNVNRIKMIKRQMFGRANPDLLRRRILLGN